MIQLVMGKDSVKPKNAAAAAGKDLKVVEKIGIAPVPISRKRQSQLSSNYLSPQALTHSSAQRLEYKIDHVKNTSAFRNNDFRVLNKNGKASNKIVPTTDQHVIAPQQQQSSSDKLKVQSNKSLVPNGDKGG